MHIPELIPNDPPPKGKIRTHLANERTYLAWGRTGLTMIALGLGAAQLLDRHVLPAVALDTLPAELGQEVPGWVRGGRGIDCRRCTSQSSSRTTRPRRARSERTWRTSARTSPGAALA